MTPASLRPDGITAPSSVPEGSTGPVEVDVQGASEIIVEVTASGERLTVSVGTDGKAQFELPQSAVAGTSLLIIDADNPGTSAEVAITPASTSPP